MGPRPHACTCAGSAVTATARDATVTGDRDGGVTSTSAPEAGNSLPPRLPSALCLVGALALAAREDERPQRWVRACVESETVTAMAPRLTPRARSR